MFPVKSADLPLASEWGHQTVTATPAELIAALSEATNSAIRDYAALPDEREPCSDVDGYYRASVEIRLPPTLFDQLMNGPTGYRAHYSVSVESGEEFNRQLVDAVAPLIVEAEDLYTSRFSRMFCTRSLLGPFSKFWYPKELTDLSAQADLLRFKEVLRHPRWRNHWNALPKPHKGLLAPVPKNTSVLLNGTFVNDDGNVYEQKPGRSQQLFETGWT